MTTIKHSSLQSPAVVRAQERIKAYVKAAFQRTPVFEQLEETSFTVANSYGTAKRMLMPYGSKSSSAAGVLESEPVFSSPVSSPKPCSTQAVSELNTSPAPTR